MTQAKAPKPAAKAAAPATFRFLSASGATMMEVEYVGRSGDKLMMRGKMMGEFRQDIYLPVEQFERMVLVSARPGPVLFVLLAPFLGALRSLRGGRSQSRDWSGGLVSALLLSMVLLAPLLFCVMVVAAVLATPIWLALSAASFATRRFASPPAKS